VVRPAQADVTLSAKGQKLRIFARSISFRRGPVPDAPWGGAWNQTRNDCVGSAMNKAARSRPGRGSADDGIKKPSFRREACSREGEKPQADNGLSFGI
jgi:hypothetical protein